MTFAPPRLSPRSPLAGRALALTIEVRFETTACASAAEHEETPRQNHPDKV
jgi:hypothetical protein